MCPLNDGTPVAHADLVAALKAMAPILRARGLIGLVEPLGFPVSSLRSKREALAAIDAAGGGDVYRLVHDTFHHHLAGETEFFPERTGLVHISGVIDPDVSVDDMLDAHRVLVDGRDRLENLPQIKALLALGYRRAVQLRALRAPRSMTWPIPRPRFAKAWTMWCGIWRMQQPRVCGPLRSLREGEAPCRNHWTSSPSAAPRSTCTASRSAGGWRTWGRSRSTSAARRPTSPAGTARLGLTSAVITGVGDEHMGRFILEQLAREGVDTRGVKVDPERLTALVILGIRDDEQLPADLLPRELRRHGADRGRHRRGLHRRGARRCWRPGRTSATRGPRRRC